MVIYMNYYQAKRNQSIVSSVTQTIISEVGQSIRLSTIEGLGFGYLLVALFISKEVKQTKPTPISNL